MSYESRIKDSIMSDTHFPLALLSKERWTKCKHNFQNLLQEIKSDKFLPPITSTLLAVAMSSIGSLLYWMLLIPTTKSRL